MLEGSQARPHSAVALETRAERELQHLVTNELARERLLVLIEQRR